MPFMVVRSGVRSPNKKWQNGTNTKLRLCTQNSAKISCVQRRTPNNACRAELGWYPLIIKIQKRAVKFYNHLKGSDFQTFHNKAITNREMDLEKSPLNKQVLGLCSKTQTHPTDSQDSSTIRPNQIMRKQEYNYMTHLKDLTKKQSKVECYLALNRETQWQNSWPLWLTLNRETQWHNTWPL